MRILWITNIMFPALCKEMNLPSPVIGGWMYSSAEALIKMDPQLRLAVATVYQGKEYKKIEVGKIVYYLLPLKRSKMVYQSQLEFWWKKVSFDFQPELVHLHGTEYAHGLAFLNACPRIKSVVSIQGLVSVCARYYYAGISVSDMFKNITLRDMIRRDNIFQQKQKFQKQGIIEKSILRKVNHVIGRTSWDRVHSLALNPHIHYHFCNETLRPEFYKHTWKYETCEKHSIFLSQAGYPIKGLHQVLKALPLVLKEFPDTRVYVAGANITGNTSFRERLKLTGYGKYIKSLIRKYKLENKIVFTGLLDMQQMCERYLRSHVFICPSSIENSPNSLGEAQIMGVPCVASYVGGIPDMMSGDEGYLYRFEEVEMLAEQMLKVFRADFTTKKNDVRNIVERHDPQKNVERLMEIYHEICE